MRMNKNTLNESSPSVTDSPILVNAKKNAIIPYIFKNKEK